MRYYRAKTPFLRAIAVPVLIAVMGGGLSGALTGCTEARYAAHLVKKIPMPGEVSKTQGTFKVGTPYKIDGKLYKPYESYTHEETGIASWYGPNFHGKQTANGEIFDQNELTAAHRTLQMPSLARVTNLENGRSLILRINDRGPYSRGRVLDVSKRGAELLGFRQKGTARVKIQVLEAESRKIAEIAKRGIDTRGFEVALNRGRPLPSFGGNAGQVQLASLSSPSPANVSQAPVSQAPVSQAPVSQVQVSQVQVSQVQVSQAAGGPQGSFQTASLGPVDLTPVESVPLADAAGVQGAGSGSAGPTGIRQGISDNLVKTVPVGPSNIYVQAGSFAQEQNALRLSERLRTIGPSKVYKTDVRGQPFFRVRLGPYTRVAQADTALSNLIRSGNADALIIVD